MSVAFVSDAVELAVPPSVRALADGSTNVVKRGRRVSVVPGSLKSARESQEREKERELKAKIQNRKAKNELRQKLASNVLKAGAFFIFFDENHNGFMTRESFKQVVSAMGLSTDACDLLVDEMLQTPEARAKGRIPYADFLQFALRDALAKKAVELTDICKAIDKQTANAGVCTKDEFRLAVRQLGWEMPSTLLVDALFDSLDQQGTGALTFPQLTRALREGTASDLADELHKQRAIGRGNEHEITKHIKPTNKVPLRRGSLMEQYEANLAIWYPRMPSKLRNEEFDGEQQDGVYGRRKSTFAGAARNKRLINQPPVGLSFGGFGAPQPPSRGSRSPARRGSTMGRRFSAMGGGGRRFSAMTREIMGTGDSDSDDDDVMPSAIMNRSSARRGSTRRVSVFAPDEEGQMPGGGRRGSTMGSAMDRRPSMGLVGLRRKSTAMPPPPQHITSMLDQEPENKPSRDVFGGINVRDHLSDFAMTSHVEKSEALRLPSLTPRGMSERSEPPPGSQSARARLPGLV